MIYYRSIFQIQEFSSYFFFTTWVCVCLNYGKRMKEKRNFHFVDLFNEGTHIFCHVLENFNNFFVLHTSYLHKILKKKKKAEHNSSI